MRTKEYTFRAGFSIKPRSIPGGVFHAMGDTHVVEAFIYEVYIGGRRVGTCEDFAEAKALGASSLAALRLCNKEGE